MSTSCWRMGCANATERVHEGNLVTVSCAEGDTGYIYDGLLETEISEVQRGDMPYEHQSASEDLIARRPEVAFFRGSPVLGMLDTGSKLLVGFSPETYSAELK